MDLIIDLINRYQPMIEKILNPVVVILWRLGLGRLFNILPAVAGRTMIIKHYDLKNGTPIFTPVNFSERENVIICSTHQRSNPELGQNLMANSQVEIWLPDGWYAGQADLVELPSDRLPLLQSLFSDNPLLARITGIDMQAEGEEFESAVNDLSIVRITRQSPRTGVNGPGGLSWLWPFILVFVLGLRPRRRR
ncbi:MAG: hypothetical protein FJZ98_05505 [Chloroflexi bacterium]|nr:hypothetical protein [Chloroflexota bacterium]